MRRIASTVATICSLLFVILLVVYRESEYKEIAIMVAVLVWTIGAITTCFLVYRVFKDAQKKKDNR